MKILVAVDSFKGSLSSIEAGRAIADGIFQANALHTVDVAPLADGGEGTTESLTLGLGGRFVEVETVDPLGEPITARFGVLPDGGAAVVEASAAAGLTLVPPEKRNPLLASSYGFGVMTLEAMKQGYRRFIIGLGGSAVNDGGVGFLQALGFGFFTASNEPIRRGAIGLFDLERVETETATPLLRECEFRVACDVSNPLCGENGASMVYGPQKGATPEMTRRLDAALARFAERTRRAKPSADPNYPGSGAAGGLGYAFHAFLNATLESGVAIVLEETKLAERVAWADLVVTGEGRFDRQTLMGKAPIGVAKLAKRFGKPVILLAGAVRDQEVERAGDYGVDAYFPILREVRTLQENMSEETARANLTHSSAQIFRLLNLPICSDR